MVEKFANSGDPDQMSCFAVSDLILHCLPVTLLGVSRIQWVNVTPWPLLYISAKTKLNHGLYVIFMWFF